MIQKHKKQKKIKKKEPKTIELNKKEEKNDISKKVFQKEIPLQFRTQQEENLN